MNQIVSQLPASWPEWATPDEVAGRWRIHRSTIYRMHHQEAFGKMFRGSLRIHRSEIEAAERKAEQQLTTKAVRNVRNNLSYRRPAGAIDHFAS